MGSNEDAYTAAVEGETFLKRDPIPGPYRYIISDDFRGASSRVRDPYSRLCSVFSSRQ